MRAAPGGTSKWPTGCYRSAGALAFRGLGRSQLRRSPAAARHDRPVAQRRLPVHRPLERAPGGPVEVDKPEAVLRVVRGSAEPVRGRVDGEAGGQWKRRGAERKDEQLHTGCNVWSLTQRCEESGTHGGRPSDVPGGTEQRQRSFNQTASPRQSARITRYRVWSTVTRSSHRSAAQRQGEHRHGAQSTRSRRVWQYRSWRRRSALGLSGEDHAPRLAHAPPNAHARLRAHWEVALRRYGNAQAQLPTRTPRDSHATRTASGRRASERRQTSVGARTIVARSVSSPRGPNLRTKRVEKRL